jgi:hypothetical protein
MTSADTLALILDVFGPVNVDKGRIEAKKGAWKGSRLAQ